MIGNVAPNLQNRLSRPKSQDAAYRSRSPATNAFYLAKELPETEDEVIVIQNEVSPECEHQYTCPWSKARKLRSREKVMKDDLHPRPWGARSPDDIQCTCKVSKTDTKRPFKPLTIPLVTNMKSPAHNEVNKALENACKQIEKVKIILTKDEVNEFSKKVKTSLEKKIITKNSDKKAGKKTSSAQNARVVTPTKQLRPTNQTNMDNMLMSQPGAMHMTPTAVVGTMESTNYVIELSAQPRNNHGEIKNIMSQVIPLSMNNEYKPRLVNLDGTYFAEIPNEFGVVPSVNQIRAAPIAGIFPMKTNRSRSHSN